MGQTVVASSDIIPPPSSEYSRVEARADQRLKSFRGLIVNKTKPIVVSSPGTYRDRGSVKLVLRLAEAYV